MFLADNSSSVRMRSPLALIVALVFGINTSLAGPDTNAGALRLSDSPDAIALGKHTQSGNEETWLMRRDMAEPSRSVQNVSQPTLTPVLPDPENANGTAVVIAPGGGFFMLAIDSEGYEVARWLADNGVAAFVLKYRLKSSSNDPAEFRSEMAKLFSKPLGEEPLFATPEAVEDAKAAVRLVRERAKDWNVDPNRVGFIGFSAGAMTAIDVALVEDEKSRPDFVAPIYPPMMARDVPDYAPPLFVGIALDDPLFARNKSMGLLDAWRKTGASVEAHLYSRGGHGYGFPGSNAATALWPGQFYAWMQDQGFLAEKVPLEDSGKGLSVNKSSINELLAHSQAKQVLLEYVPQLVNSEQIGMMGNQTLVGLSAYASEMLSDDVLQKLQSEFSKINDEQ